MCDTSGLIAFFDASDAHHQEVAEVVAAESGPFVVSPFVLAELDYLLATRRGSHAQLAALAELANGAWELPQFTAADLLEAHRVMTDYGDQTIGLADASLVVLGDRRRTDRVLTLDRRHFHVLRTGAGRPFQILP